MGSSVNGADDEAPILSLPPEVLQHVCSFLHNQRDLASFHMVDTRHVNVLLSCASAVT